MAGRNERDSGNVEDFDDPERVDPLDPIVEVEEENLPVDHVAQAQAQGQGEVVARPLQGEDPPPGNQGIPVPVEEDDDLGGNGSVSESNSDLDDPDENIQNQLAVNIPVAAMAQAPVVTCPRYSGYKKGVTYQTAQGPATEVFDVLQWLEEFDDACTISNFSAAQKLAQAKAALVPGSPAKEWYNSYKDEKDFSVWDVFEASITEFFNPPLNTTERVAILDSFKQRKNERVQDFHVRVRNGYKRFCSNFQAFSGPLATQDATVIADRNLLMSNLRSYHIASFFQQGLHRDISQEVVRSGVSTLTEMLDVAKNFESSRLQPQAGKAQVAAVDASPVDSRLPSLRLAWRRPLRLCSPSPSRNREILLVRVLALAANLQRLRRGLECTASTVWKRVTWLLSVLLVGRTAGLGNGGLVSRTPS